MVHRFRRMAYLPRLVYFTDVEGMAYWLTFSTTANVIAYWLHTWTKLLESSTDWCPGLCYNYLFELYNA